jgi:hypothetical protein
MMTLGMMLVMISAMMLMMVFGHNVGDVICDKGNQLLEIKWNKIERSTMLQSPKQNLSKSSK